MCSSWSFERFWNQIGCHIKTWWRGRDSPFYPCKQCLAALWDALAALKPRSSANFYSGQSCWHFTVVVVQQFTRLLLLSSNSTGASGPSAVSLSVLVNLTLQGNVHGTWLSALVWCIMHVSSSQHGCKYRIHEGVACYKHFLRIHSGLLPINNVTLLSAYQWNLPDALSCVLSSAFFFEVCVDMDTDLHLYTRKWSIWCFRYGKIGSDHLSGSLPWGVWRTLFERSRLRTCVSVYVFSPLKNKRRSINSHLMWILFSDFQLKRTIEPIWPPFW